MLLLGRHVCHGIRRAQKYPNPARNAWWGPLSRYLIALHERFDISYDKLWRRKSKAFLHRPSSSRLRTWPALSRDPVLVLIEPSQHQHSQRLNGRNGVGSGRLQLETCAALGG